MKKLIVLLTICALAICLAGCGGSGGSTESSESEESSSSTGDWFFPTSVDEFGDVVEADKIYIESISKGDFSNTATSSSDLKAETIMYIGDNASHMFVFNLLEYNDTPATYTSNANMSMKVKFADGNISDCVLYGTPPNGFVQTGFNGEGDAIFDSLGNGNDVKVVIYIDNSQYNFTISSNGFKEICEQALEKAEGKVEAKTSKDNTTAINNILNEEDGSDFLLDAYNYYEDNKESYPIMSDEEIKEEIKGDFYTASFNIQNNIIMTYRYIESYDGKERTQKLYYKNGIKDTAPEEQNESKEYTIENGFVIYGDTYEVRKISDGYYLFYGPESITSDAIVLKEFIMKVKLDGSQYAAEYPIPE